MAAALQFPENAFGGHLAFEVLDRTLESTITHVNFNRFTLYCFARHEILCLLRAAEAYTA